jgi:hypothetical protein
MTTEHSEWRDRLIAGMTPADLAGSGRQMLEPTIFDSVLAPRTGLDEGTERSPPWVNDGWFCPRCGVGAATGLRMHRCADLNPAPVGRWRISCYGFKVLHLVSDLE